MTTFETVAGMCVARSESDDGWWSMAFRAPAPALRAVVRRYTGYVERSTVPVVRREVPTGDVTLVLSFGPPIAVADAPSADGVRTGLTSFAVPVSDQWAVTKYTGQQYGLEITLTPIGASRLLGVPLDELASQPAVALDDLLGERAWSLVERLAEQPDWAARFALLDDVLPVLLSRGRAPSPAAAWAWQRLRGQRGRLLINDVVEELGCSHRSLLTEFRRHVGVSPKTFAQVLRCQHAIELINSGEHSFAEIARLAGYSDQAHLNRQFRRLTGLPPSRWHTEFTFFE